MTLQIIDSGKIIGSSASLDGALTVHDKDVANGIAGLGAGAVVADAQLPTDLLKDGDKNVNNGVAGLDSGAVVEDAQLPTGALIKAGFYTGNGAAARGIPHSIGAEADLVIITCQVGGVYHFVGTLAFSALGVEEVTAIDATNFYVGKTDKMGNTANINTYVYKWRAFKSA